MRRREFITLLGGAAGWPLAARAQQPKVYRIGVLMGIAEGDEESQGRIATLRQTLQELGWIEGRNVQFEVRFSAGDPEQARDYAAELLSLTPDVVLAHSSLALGALRQAARTIPIVFAQVPDPVGGGFVAKSAASGRQHHRLHELRVPDEQQMARAAQGDRTNDRPCRGSHPFRVPGGPGTIAGPTISVIVVGRATTSG